MLTRDAPGTLACVFVCLCKGVSDRTVRRLVEEGARTRDEISARCGAGTVCGGCESKIEELLDEFLTEAARRS